MRCTLYVQVKYCILRAFSPSHCYLFRSHQVKQGYLFVLSQGAFDYGRWIALHESYCSSNFLPQSLHVCCDQWAAERFSFSDRYNNLRLVRFHRYIYEFNWMCLAYRPASKMLPRAQQARFLYECAITEANILSYREYAKFYFLIILYSFTLLIIV